LHGGDDATDGGLRLGRDRGCRRRRRLTKIAGRYRVTRKLQPDEIECEELTVTVRRGRGRSRRSGAFGGRDEGPFEATVVMSRELLNSGRGHYTHVKCVDGRPQRLYGFIELQVVAEDDGVLVHHTYADPNDRAVVSGYVWNPI
jgi:hypothetical protein